MAAFARRVTDHPLFHRLVLSVILFNAALIGVETSRDLMSRHGTWLQQVNLAIQVVFVVEIALRLAAHGRRWPAFFRDGWNAFDAGVVAASFLPVAGPFATVGRLARVLRVARLTSTMPELRLIVATMLRSIPSMSHVILLLGLLIYIYAVIGFHLFGDHDPVHWGTLGAALLTLFQILTLEGWVEVQKVSMERFPFAWLYYGSFVIVAVLVVTNLFIAVVINNLEAAKAEEQGTAALTPAALRDDLRAVHDQLSRIEAALAAAHQIRSAIPSSDGGADLEIQNTRTKRHDSARR
jgi:voltage-gated sodium channel